MAAFVQDSFTDTPGNLLLGHVGEIGATWTKGAGLASSNFKFDASGTRIAANNGSTNNYFFASGLAAQDGSYCEIAYDVVTAVNSIGCMVRASDNRGYHALVGPTTLKIRRLETTKSFVDLTFDSGGTTKAITNAAGSSHVLRITATGTGSSVLVEVHIDGVLIGAVTDVSAERVTALGSVGVVGFGPFDEAAGFFLKSIVGNAASVAATALSFTTVPVTGKKGVASSLITVTANGSLAAPIVATPSDGADNGTFSVASVELSDAAPSASYTYTPDTVGIKALSVTNSGGLSNPAAANYTVTPHTATVTLIDRANVAQASLTGLKWAWFDQTTPDLFLAPTDKGAVESSDVVGLMRVELPNSSKLPGQVGCLVVTNSDGTVATNHKFFFGPTAVD